MLPGRGEQVERNKEKKGVDEVAASCPPFFSYYYFPRVPPHTMVSH